MDFLALSFVVDIESIVVMCSVFCLPQKKLIVIPNCSLHYNEMEQFEKFLVE